MGKYGNLILHSSSAPSVLASRIHVNISVLPQLPRLKIGGWRKILYHYLISITTGLVLTHLSSHYLFFLWISVSNTEPATKQRNNYNGGNEIWTQEISILTVFEIFPWMLHHHADQDGEVSQLPHCYLSIDTKELICYLFHDEYIISI